MDPRAELGKSIMALLDELGVKHGDYSLTPYGISVVTYHDGLVFQLTVSPVQNDVREMRILLPEGSFLSKDLKRGQSIQDVDEVPDWAVYFGFWRLAPNDN